MKGLSSAQAQQLLKNGYNEIPEKRISLFQKILKNFISPIALMLLLASLLSFILGKVFDAYFILFLLFLNLAITLWQENKADRAIKNLNENLDIKVKVLRDNLWQFISSKLLVPGDVIRLSQGDVIPADGKIIEQSHSLIDESVLTGESLPKEKKVGDDVFSGSFVSSGIITIGIDATGQRTKFGQTLTLVEQDLKKSLLEKDILSISKFLTSLSLIAVLLLSVVLLISHSPILELLTLDLSLVIAGIPISLPTVMTLIIEFGVINLARKNVIVRRLSALEDLANVNFLLTDKTGTLTQNKIRVEDVYAYDGFTHNDVLLYAETLALVESDDPIDLAISEKVTQLKLNPLVFTKVDFIPADSERKRSTLLMKIKDQDLVVSVGAPQIIEAFCQMDQDKSKFNREVEALARLGYRTLAIAIAHGIKEEKMRLVGLIALSDTLRDDAKLVVSFLKENGIEVSMVTGDNRAIASNIASELNLGGRILTKADLDKLDWNSIDRQFYQQTSAFAEILPEDKLKLVQKAKQFFVVASNGDGINDLPALKVANVGIVVKSAVAALKSTADIVLLSEGISVIRDSIIESRKIFERLYVYSLYRISESLRLIVTVAILGIAYRVYPLTALQIIVIALLNDIPIISLSSDRVKLVNRPAKIDAKKRFTLSSLYGMVGVANSLILFFILHNLLRFDWGVIQTMYFLKLTVSGHMLIYVAHTKERWWKFFPSSGVIWATTLTQLTATALALSGFLMPKDISIENVMVVWIWSFLWMQVAEFLKYIQDKNKV